MILLGAKPWDGGPTTISEVTAMREHVVEVTFKGEASSDLAAAFHGLDVVVDRGVTRLHVAGGDPAALHGLLEEIAALGLELIGVRELDE